MLTVTIDQSEGISGADIPEQAVKKMRTGSAALSLPSPRAFFAFLITERLSTTISEPGTGYFNTGSKIITLTQVSHKKKLVDVGNIKYKRWKLPD